MYHDIVASADDSLTADDIFNSEIMEFYGYDDKWRIVGVFRAGPATETVRVSLNGVKRKSQRV